MTTTSTDAEASTASLGIASWLVLLMVAATPLIFATGFSQFEDIKQFVLVFGGGLAFLIWGGQVVIRGQVGMVAGRVVSLLGAFGLYALASIVWSPGLLYGSIHAAHLLALVAVVVILSAPIGRPVRFLDFAAAVTIGVGGSGVFGMLDLAGLEIFTQVWDPRGPTGTFGAMEFAVAYYAVAIPVTVAGTQYTDGWKRIIFGIAAVLGAAHFGLVLDWTFVSMFVGVTVVTVGLILAFEGVETSTVLAPIGAMVAFVVLVAFVAAQLVSVPAEPTEATSLPALERGPGISQRVLEEKELRNPAFAIGRMEAVRSNEVRQYLAGVSFDLFQERPFVGRGAGAWWRLQTKQINIDHPAVQQRFVQYPAYRSPHNAWSLLAVEYGLVGLALFGLWLAGCIAVGIGALGRSAEHSDLIIEQWGLWATMFAGLAFATMTPLLELTAPALVWFGAVGVLTRRSAAVNDYTGASMRWTIGEGGAGGRAVGLAVGGLSVLASFGMVVITTTNTVSQLYRGWGDHLMLRTYYQRAIERYETADAWMPAHGDVLYNIARAKSRVGELHGDVREKVREVGKKLKKQRTSPGQVPARGETGDEPAPDAGTADAGGRGADESAGRAESVGRKGDEQPSRQEVVRGTPSFQLLKRAVEMRPYDARVLDMMARFYLRWRMLDEALQTARRAVEAFPNGVSARKTLAAVLRTRGRVDASAKQLLTLIEKSPPDDELVVLHLQIGRLYLQFLEEFGHAKDHFQKAASLAASRAVAKRANQLLKKAEQRIKRQERLRQGKPPEKIQEKLPPGGPAGPSK